MKYNFKLFVNIKTTISIDSDLEGCQTGNPDPKRGGTLMPYTGVRKSLNLIVSQLEAASSLVKFAASDLDDLASESHAPLPEELQIITKNLHAQAGVLEGNIAFLQRIGDDSVSADEPGKDSAGKRGRRREVSSCN